MHQRPITPIDPMKTTRNKAKQRPTPEGEQEKLPFTQPKRFPNAKTEQSVLRTLQIWKDHERKAFRQKMNWKVMGVTDDEFDAMMNKRAENQYNQALERFGVPVVPEQQRFANDL